MESNSRRGRHLKLLKQQSACDFLSPNSDDRRSLRELLAPEGGRSGIWWPGASSQGDGMCEPALLHEAASLPLVGTGGAEGSQHSEKLLTRELKAAVV